MSSHARDAHPTPWLDRRWFDSEVSLREAEEFCRNLAARHYENFTVISLLLPRRLRQHFANIYAFCRVSDDLADEIDSHDESLARLNEWQQHLELCYRGEARHPVFIALLGTTRQFDIPREPFDDLLKAFRQDREKNRYATWDELMGYCRNSANPVGRLVLYLCGYRDETRQRLSDATCTALQLTNFWQDVSRDYARDRIYIPEEFLDKYRYTEAMLAKGVLNDGWVDMMRELIEKTRFLFRRGLDLPPLLHGRVRLDIELFSRGGLEILRKIETNGYDTLRARPALTRWGEMRLFLSAVVRAVLPRRRSY